ncbi:hypothetical protein TNCT_647251 [Trichonephila clavata]|uniref:Uncharacterized protein n=1 Tax=Trichonephila clavata TaxID=2740835 RepID=A0A8X6FB25_TRICU|nr:hypothetical protein TNCT_647251 [Trichonephila clavata]
MQNQPKSYYVNNTVFLYDEGFSNRSSVQVISHLCGECNISFSQFEQSALHIQKKIKEQFYQCPLCLLCFSDINLCSEHSKTCESQSYNCAECGILLSELGEDSILEPLLFYNMADSPPDVTSKNIFKKCRLFFTVKKYQIIHKTDSLIGASLTETVNPINISGSNIETKHSVRQDSGITEDNTYSTKNDEYITLDSISETCKFESLSQRTSQLAHLHSNFFDSKNKVFTNTSQENKASDICVTEPNGGFLKKNLLAQRTDNTVESHHCKKLKTTRPELISCKSGDRVSVLGNGTDQSHVKNNKKAGNHEKAKIKQHQKNGTKSSQGKKKKTLRKPILCKFGNVKVKFFTLNKKVHHSYNFIDEQNSIENNESDELHSPLSDLKMFLPKNSKRKKLPAMEEDKCQIPICDKEQFLNILDSRKGPVANNKTLNSNDVKLLHTDVNYSKSFKHGTTESSTSKQIGMLKYMGISASRVSETHLRNGGNNDINNLMKEATGEENWEKLKNVYNLKKCSVALHKLPSQIYNVSISPLKNAFKSENKIKDLSVNLFRLPNYVQDYQSYKIYCQSHDHKTVLRKKQIKKSKVNTNFIHNILPSSAPENGDMPSVAECETSVCIKSSNHVKMLSNSNGGNSHESQMQDSCHQISEIVPESSPPILDDYEMSDDSEQHFVLQSPSNSASECSKTSNDDNCPSFSEEPVEQQFDDIDYQPMSEVSESPHLVSNFTNDMRQTASNESEDLIYCDNSQLILKSADKTRINVSDSFESSIPFILWKMEEQLKYLKDRIKYIRIILEKCKNKKVKYLEPQVLLVKLPEILVQTHLQTKFAKDIDVIEVIKLSRIRFALQICHLDTTSPTYKIFKHKPMGIRSRGRPRLMAELH